MLKPILGQECRLDPLPGKWAKTTATRRWNLSSAPTFPGLGVAGPT